jgi:hypothetical protein
VPNFRIKKCSSWCFLKIQGPGQTFCSTKGAAPKLNVLCRNLNWNTSKAYNDSSTNFFKLAAHCLADPLQEVDRFSFFKVEVGRVVLVASS